MAQTAGEGLDLAAFCDVDASWDPQALVRYMERAKTQQTLKALQPKTIEQLRLPTPARVLDVGCGLGTEALDLAERENVEVIGVDSSHAIPEPCLDGVVVLAQAVVPVDFLCDPVLPGRCGHRLIRRAWSCDDVVRAARRDSSAPAPLPWRAGGRTERKRSLNRVSLALENSGQEGRR